MGKQQRDEFKAELEKLGKIREEGTAFYEQNAKVAAAEKNLNLVENLWVRGQVD